MSILCEMKDLGLRRRRIPVPRMKEPDAAEGAQYPIRAEGSAFAASRRWLLATRFSARWKRGALAPRIASCPDGALLALGLKLTKNHLALAAAAFCFLK
jgi:hypothetical protein